MNANQLLGIPDYTRGPCFVLISMPSLYGLASVWEQEVDVPLPALPVGRCAFYFPAFVRRVGVLEDKSKVKRHLSGYRARHKRQKLLLSIASRV